MGTEQYRDGTVTVTNGSQIWVGFGTDWQNELSLPCVVKVDLDGESTYSVAAIISATRLHLSANYNASTNSGLGYMAMRSWTTNRSYWRPLQGDADWAEILAQETVDKIDTDIAALMTSYSTGSAVGTNASTFAINMDATLGRFWTDNLTASRDFRLPNQNATLVGLGVAQEFSADQTFNASMHIKGNASIDGELDVGTLNITNLTIDDLNATTGDINTLHSATLTANDLNATTGDIDTLHSSVFTADDLNATTGDIETLHSTVLTASNITASSMKVSDLTNNRLVVVGADGKLEDDANLTWDGSLLNVNGNMTVTGSTVIVTASNISVKDPLILLAKNQSGAPAYDSGLIVERGTSQNVGMLWDESEDKMVVVYTDETGITSGNVTIASYGDLKVKGFQAESINASVFSASTGDIDILHAHTLTASTYTAITRANASIDIAQTDIIRANASIDTLQTDMTRANASIDISQADIVHSNASITRTNASIDTLQSGIIRSNASIDILQADVVRSNASIDILQADTVRANASIDVLQVDMTRANASITTNINGVTNANASIANNIAKATFDAKGDIITASADNVPSKLGVGANDTVLTADSTKINGLKWTIPAGGGDVAGPATNTDEYIPQWNGADSKVLKNGFAKTDLVLSADMTRANASIDILQADVIRANASIDILQPNPVLKTANYQILTTDNMILASGNITITLASASSKQIIRMGNRSLDSNASIRVKKSGGDTIENNASLMLTNKYDTACLIGDGANTHIQF